MGKLIAAVVIASLGSVPALGQRLDGCPETQTAWSEAVERGLQDSGIGTAGEALRAALSSDRPEFRSLAALELARQGKRADLDPLVEAALAETDGCNRLAFASALGMMARALVFDPAQHNGLKPWIEPFKPCRPVEPAMAQLTVAQAGSADPAVTKVEIAVRNLTAKTLPFLVTVPEELFSVSVFDAGGTPVQTKGKDYMFDRPWPAPPQSFALAIEAAPSFLFLPPGKDVHFWTWNVSDDFDVSEPGVYHVSLGGRLAYLDTTVCSNTAEIAVGK